VVLVVVVILAIICYVIMKTCKF